MLQRGDGKRARFDTRCCPQELFRRRRFYSKRLLLGAFASEDVHMCVPRVRVGDVIEPAALRRKVAYRNFFSTSIIYEV